MLYILSSGKKNSAVRDGEFSITRVALKKNRRGERFLRKLALSSGGYFCGDEYFSGWAVCAGLRRHGAADFLTEYAPEVLLRRLSELEIRPENARIAVIGGRNLFTVIEKLQNLVGCIEVQTGEYDRRRLLDEYGISSWEKLPESILTQCDITVQLSPFERCSGEVLRLFGDGEGIDFLLRGRKLCCLEAAYLLKTGEVLPEELFPFI